jgi:beta-galactosidase
LRNEDNLIAIVDEEPRQPSGQSDQSSPAVVRVREPSRDWKRSLFNGLAQVIVQSTTQSGEIMLTAEAPGLKKAVVSISTQ